VNPSIRLTGEAQVELAEAVRWYEARVPGLGKELLAAVAKTLSLLARRPELGSDVPAVRRTDVRRLLVPRFPYQIVYHRRSGDLVIVAVAHLKRRPGYWKDQRR